MQAPLTHAQAIAKACRAIDNVRLSKAATQHAIEQSRKSLSNTHLLLLKLRERASRESVRATKGAVRQRRALRASTASRSRPLS
jgi:hypothetical protein